MTDTTLAPAVTQPGPLPVPELDVTNRPLPPLPPLHVDTAPAGPSAVAPAPAPPSEPLPAVAADGTPPRRMPLLVLEPSGSRFVERARPVLLLVVVLISSMLIGRVVGTPSRAIVHDKMLPWIMGRSLGIACYLSLTGMVVLGLWLRHPWRARFRRPGPESILWAHVALAACAVALLAGHLTSLALDSYAGVGWTGVFVPWGAQFKPTAVAIGTLAFYLLLLVVGTAALAGSIGRAVWFPIHTASVVVFCLCLVHGILAGSDSVGLRWVYVLTGFVVLLLQFTRWLAGTLKHGPAVVDA